MPFERPTGFKMPLSETLKLAGLKYANPEDDYLKKNPKRFLEERLLKMEVLANLDADSTEMLFRFAVGQNVMAGFEKLRRELKDIEYISRLRKPKLLSMLPSDAAAGAKDPEIKFITRRDSFRNVTVRLVLKEQPKSTLFPDAPRDKFIRLELGRKLSAEDKTKLKEEFGQLMNGGGVMINFITNSLWPIVMRADIQQKKENQEKPTAAAGAPKYKPPRGGARFVSSGGDRRPTMAVLPTVKEHVAHSVSKEKSFEKTDFSRGAAPSIQDLKLKAPKCALAWGNDRPTREMLPTVPEEKPALGRRDASRGRSIPRAQPPAQDLKQDAPRAPRATWGSDRSTREVLLPAVPEEKPALGRRDASSRGRSLPPRTLPQDLKVEDAPKTVVGGSFGSRSNVFDHNSMTTTFQANPQFATHNGSNTVGGRFGGGSRRGRGGGGGGRRGENDSARGGNWRNRQN